MTVRCRTLAPLGHADAPGGFDAVEPGHMKVHHHEIEMLRGAGRHRRLAIVDVVNLMAAAAQKFAGEKRIHRIVFGEKDAKPSWPDLAGTATSASATSSGSSPASTARSRCSSEVCRTGLTR